MPLKMPVLPFYLAVYTLKYTCDLHLYKQYGSRTGVKINYYNSLN